LPAKALKGVGLTGNLMCDPTAASTPLNIFTISSDFVRNLSTCPKLANLSNRFFKATRYFFRLLDVGKANWPKVKLRITREFAQLAHYHAPVTVSHVFRAD
jgi:hypothetical protein